MPERTRKPNVTQEDFNEAVKKLNAENKAISVRNVRAITGGANETIGLLIREYQRNAMAANFKDKMPESFQESVIKACLTLYDQFEAKITKDRMELQDQYDARQREILSLLAEADQKTEEAENRAQALEEERQALKQEIKQLRERVDQLTDELAARTSEQTQSKETLDKLMQMLTAMQDEQQAQKNDKA